MLFVILLLLEILIVCNSLLYCIIHERDLRISEIPMHLYILESKMFIVYLTITLCNFVCCVPTSSSDSLCAKNRTDTDSTVLLSYWWRRHIFSFLSDLKINSRLIWIWCSLRYTDKRAEVHSKYVDIGLSIYPHPFEKEGIHTYI